MKIDYLIVGQGLCGSLLSRSLMGAGKHVIVIDEVKQHTASKIASGLINPVTGMRMAKAWMIDELLPAARAMYQAFEQETGATVLQPIDIIDFHKSEKDREIFRNRTQQYREYLSSGVAENEFSPYFRFDHGVGKINGSCLVDIKSLIETWRSKLLAADCLIDDVFDYVQLKIIAGKVYYKDMEAEKIIFCDGASGVQNPFFSVLPFALNKGQVLIAEIDGLPREHVFLHGLKVAPWENNLYWVGSSFEWTFTDDQPSPAFKEKTESELKTKLKLPFKIVAHWAAVRPATANRYPLVGLHPRHPEVGMFNGMGAKGCSQAPFFAEQFTRHLVNGTSLAHDVDIALKERLFT